MGPDTFEEKVTILLGLGVPAEVKSVMQAYQILVDWRSRDDHARNLALKACRAALNGEVDAQTARAVFVAFAEKHDLVAPEIDGLIAGRHGRQREPHVR